MSAVLLVGSAGGYAIFNFYKTRDGSFRDSSQEYICEETGDEVVLMKDRAGRVIGFEKLNFSVPESDSLSVALETAPA